MSEVDSLLRQYVATRGADASGEKIKQLIDHGAQKEIVEEEAAKRLLRTLNDKRLAILAEDLNHPRQYSGGITDIAIDINSHYDDDGWLVYMSEDGDPVHDDDSKTPAYIIGVLRNDCLPALATWGQTHGLEIRLSDNNIKFSPYDKTSHINIVNPPNNDITISNWFKFYRFALGEDVLPIEPPERAPFLTEILRDYSAVVVEDTGTRFKNGTLWKYWNAFLATLHGRDKANTIKFGMLRMTLS
jgi:hypothetical protein